MLDKSHGIGMCHTWDFFIVAPITAVVVGVLMQLSPIQMGVMFIMVTSPVAAASYVMARSMGGNEILAANILGFTTVFSMFSLAIGMALLRHFGLA